MGYPLQNAQLLNKSWESSLFYSVALQYMGLKIVFSEFMRFCLLWEVWREFLVKRLILLEFFFDVENLGENFFCAALWGQNRNSEQIAAPGRIRQKSVKLHAPKRKMFSGTWFFIFLRLYGLYRGQKCNFLTTGRISTFEGSFWGSFSRPIQWWYQSTWFLTFWGCMASKEAKNVTF